MLGRMICQWGNMRGRCYCDMLGRMICQWGNMRGRCYCVMLGRMIIYVSGGICGGDVIVLCWEG